MANALKEIEHAQRLCDRGDITIGEYFDLVEKWEDAEPTKHGRWTGIGKNKYNDDEATCSICGVTFASDYSNPSWWDYCPNCGAKMDEQQEVQ